ncbi:MAG: hypothetical protein EAZ55_09280 [Cytophagales bacterium]|nr:MAG: hypothetical protein EAZ55_09280 [Cytophagales bacterium]
MIDIAYAQFDKESFSTEIDALKAYETYNEFKYFSKVTLSRDEEKTFPRHFEIKLPKGIIYIHIINIDVFYFRFLQRERIAFIVKNEGLKDCSYQNINYIEGRLSVSDVYEYLDKLPSDEDKLKKRKIKAKRAHFCVKDNDMVIILYNIKPKNLERYIDLVKQHYMIPYP